MKQIKFPQQRRDGTFIDDLNMLLYIVYDNGSFDTIKVPSVQEGLKRIPFIMPDILLIKFTIPKINGYEIRLIEKSKGNEKATLVYVAR